MKKLLLVVAMVALGFTASAQKVKFGPKVGLNISNLNGNDDFKTDSRASFFVGGMAELMLSDKFALQPELLYSSQGAKAEGEGALGEAVYTTKLDYLNIPVMAKYFVIDNLALEFGPQVGFLTSATRSLEASAGVVSVSANEVDIKDDVNSIDFGLNLGASYTLDFGLNIGARYNLGLTDIAKDNDGDAIKNGVFQISVGYFF